MEKIDAKTAMEENNAKLLMSGDQTIRGKVKRRIKYMLDTTIDNSIREKYLYLEQGL